MMIDAPTQPIPVGPHGAMPHPGARPRPASTGPRWPRVAGALAVVVVALGLGAAMPTSSTLHGSVTVYASNYLPAGVSCTGRGLEPGSSVTVYDDSGAVAGVGRLAVGTATASGSGMYGYADTCVFPYTVDDVASSESYFIAVGSGLGVAFTAAEAAAGADIAVRG